MATEDDHRPRRTLVTIEPRAVSLETAAAMFEWSTGRFDRWRRRYGLDYAPGSNRFVVADIDAAVQAWRQAGSPVLADEEEDPFDRALQLAAEKRDKDLPSPSRRRSRRS
jgi:hypothetical protein